MMRIAGPLLACCVLFLPALAEEPSPTSTESIVARNEAAVVVLFGARGDSGQTVQSSGCAISPGGHILTTAHQIAGASDLQAKYIDGTQAAVQVLELDVSGEIALLLADPPPPAYAAIGDARDLRNGMPLLSIAAPMNLNYSVVNGMVSSTHRTYRGYPVVQAQLAASPGSSGGPVFDPHGRLAGMVIGKLAEQQWATVVNPVNNAYPLLRRHGIRPPERDLGDADEMALAPAEGISTKELRAVESYNVGVAASEPGTKREAYLLAATLLPDFYEAWFNLGVTLARMGRESEAEAAYLRARTLRPEAHEVQRNLGLLYLERGRLDQAKGAFEAAVSLAPARAQGHNDLGEVLRRLEQIEQAIKQFERALSMDPSYAKAHYNLGLTLAGAGDAARAIEHFEAYLEARPAAADAAEVRGWIARLRENL